MFGAIRPGWDVAALIGASLKSSSSIPKRHPNTYSPSVIAPMATTAHAHARGTARPARASCRSHSATPDAMMQSAVFTFMLAHAGTMLFRI